LNYRTNGFGRKNKAFPVFLPANNIFVHETRSYRTGRVFQAVGNYSCPPQPIHYATIVLLTACLLLVAVAQGQGIHFSHPTILYGPGQKRQFLRKVLELKRIPEPFHDSKHVWSGYAEHGQLHVVSGAKEDIPHDIISTLPSVSPP